MYWFIQEISKLFVWKKVKLHCCQIKQEKAERVILENLDHSTSIGDIKGGVEKLGLKVPNVSNTS